MKTNKIFLDTIYLLPLFEIETDVFTKKDLELILESNIELYFNPISLIEIKWVIIRINKKNKKKLEHAREIYKESVDYLLYSDEIQPTILLDGKISYLEDILHDAGIKDYFDRIIAASAKIFTGKLLTEDEDLTKIIRNVNEFSDLEVLSWQELTRNIKH